MRKDAVLPREIVEMARKDPLLAHVEARRRVSEQPDDEEAALHLREVLTRFPPPRRAPAPDPIDSVAAEVRQAFYLLKQGEEEQAEILLRRHLAHHQRDTTAMRLMAEIAARCGFLENAEKILRRGLEYDPRAIDNWIALGWLLYQRAAQVDGTELVDDALAALDQALALDAEHEPALSLKASFLEQMRRLDESHATFQRLVEIYPDSSKAWMNLGYVLKTIGRFGDAVAAYRTSVTFDPSNGNAWWGLANLKLSRFFGFDVDAMEKAVATNLSDPADVTIRFALYKALNDRRQHEAAAEYLIEANRLRLERHPYEPTLVQKSIDRSIATFTRQYFAKRSNAGAQSAAPIFIVGMPRSGSTLIEQILSSHSRIEGVEEMFATQSIRVELTASHPSGDLEEAIVAASSEQLTRLGERYLRLTAQRRSTDRPFFIDKNPANWRYLGLILSVLPNAKIIDARRNPMDCCFGNFVQHFSLGVEFAYGQREVATHYAEYVRLMRHFDTVLPGRVHRVIHDDLVEDLEGEVRRMLDYLELPFEEQCLRFFETSRPIFTPSAEQVRKPVNRSGFGRWRPYEPWLGELKESLGELVEDWR